jgi:phosphatidylserine decarboxylase
LSRLFAAFQHVLPQHALSRLVHHATRSRAPALKNTLIRAFVRGFRPDLSDAVEPDALAYETFNHFFTRALRQGSRPLDADPLGIASPVDGTVSECGAIDGDRLLQAKGRHYTLAALLAGDADLAHSFEGGAFATIYLAPYNYHRIHLPLAGTLIDARYVPGRLFSVNRATADAVPGLFARNERVVCVLDAPPRYALVLVGALNVGSMETVWHGEVTPRRPRHAAVLPLDGLRAPRRLPKGAEMGRFNMGSTVILLFPRGTTAWAPGFVPGRTVRMGERIGTLRRV